MVGKGGSGIFFVNCKWIIGYIDLFINWYVRILINSKYWYVYGVFFWKLYDI